MLDVTADGVTLDILGQSQALFALNIEREQRVSHLHREEGFMAGQRNVDRVNVATVKDGGHAAGTTCAAGSTLTNSVRRSAEIVVSDTLKLLQLSAGKREIRPARNVFGGEESQK